MRMSRIASLFTRAIQLSRVGKPQAQILTSVSLPDIANGYRPTLYLSHPLLQSVYNLAEPKVRIGLRREKLYLEDGGHISLDWAGKEQVLENQKIQNGERTSQLLQNGFRRQQINIDTSLENENNRSLQKNQPILFLMHGLTGGSQSNYIKALMAQAVQEGYVAVCMNSRGINNEMTSPMPFTGVGHEDLEVAIRRVRERYPNSGIYMVGTSFGGNYLLRYLLKHSADSHRNIKAFVGLAPPFNINTCIEDMHPIYQKFFVKRYIQETVLKHPLMKYWSEIGLINIQKVLKSQNLHQFHSETTARILGMSSAEEVFHQYNVEESLIEKLQIPTLIMAAKDDPIVTYRSFPTKQLGMNQNVTFMTTQKGGHLCWFQGLLPKRWYPKPTLAFFKKVREETELESID